MLLEQIAFWHWWIAAILLVVIEVFAPGAVFIWLGIAAACVGLLLLVMPQLGWEIQFLVWALLSVASMVGWRAYARRHPTESDDPTLNRRGEQYIGRLITLHEPVVNGIGKIRIDDSTWKVECEDDLDAGIRVRVTAVRGTTLIVEAAA